MSESVQISRQIQVPTRVEKGKVEQHPEEQLSLSEVEARERQVEERIVLGPKREAKLEKLGAEAMAVAENRLKEMGPEVDVLAFIRSQVSSVAELLEPENLEPFVQEIVEHQLAAQALLDGAKVEKKGSRFVAKLIDPDTSKGVMGQGKTAVEAREALKKALYAARLKLLTPDQRKMMKRLTQAGAREAQESGDATGKITDKALTFQELISSMSAQPILEGQVNPALDVAQVVSLASNLAQLVESRGLFKQAEKLLAKADALRAKGNLKGAEVYRKRGLKAYRVAYGSFMSGAMGTAAAAFPTVGGIGTLAGVSAMGVAGSTGGAILGLVAGSWQIGTGARKVHSSLKAKTEIRALQDQIVREYAKLPGTEAEVDLSGALLRQKKHELNLKHVSGAFDVTSGTVGVASAVAAGVATVVAGAATAGVGTVVAAAVGASIVATQAIAKHKMKRSWKQYQEDLQLTGRGFETTESAYAALYFQIKSEMEMEALRAQGKKDPYKTGTMIVVEGKEVRGRGVRRALFKDIICPKIFGVSGEAYVQMVEAAAEVLAPQTAKDHPEIMATLRQRQGLEKPRSLEGLQPVLTLSKEREAQLRLDLRVESDPVWSSRLQRAMVTGDYGARWRSGGRKELKQTTRVQREIVKRGGGIQRMIGQLEKLDRDLEEKKYDRGRAYIDEVVRLGGKLKKLEMKLGKVGRQLKKAKTEEAKAKLVAKRRPLLEANTEARKALETLRKAHLYPTEAREKVRERFREKKVRVLSGIEVKRREQAELRARLQAELTQLESEFAAAKGDRKAHVRQEIRAHEELIAQL